MEGASQFSEAPLFVKVQSSTEILEYVQPDPKP